MNDIKAFFFWPSCILILGLAAYTTYQHWGPIGHRTRPGTTYNIVVGEVVKHTGNIELTQVTFEHWQKQEISTAILKPGPMGLLVKQYIPDIVLRKLEDQGWNQSTAEIITSCTASVEFEIPMDDPAWGLISITDNVAYINAPTPSVSQINIRPETMKGWVLREDFLISGDKEKERLLREIRPNLRKKVDSPVFRATYREECRKSLEQFFLNLLTHIEKYRHVNHVYVRFSDEPTAKEK